MGNRAARLIDQLFFSRLLSNPAQADGKALFSTNHKNLLSGASSALSSDSLKKAIQLFLDQVDADGQPISVEPKYLLVPTALKHLAIELTQGATLIMSGTDNAVRPALNVLSDENLQVISSPYLGNSAYEGSSQTGWYLFGDPKTVDTWEIGFLKGKRTPTVERGETEVSGSVCISILAFASRITAAWSKPTGPRKQLNFKLKFKEIFYNACTLCSEGGRY